MKRVQKTVTVQAQTAKLADGKTAVMFVPELVENLALVDLLVVKRLAEMLPKAHFKDLKREFLEKLDRTENLEQYVQALSVELSFHKSVNLLTTIQPMRAEENGPIAGWGYEKAVDVEEKEIEQYEPINKVRPVAD